MFLTALLTKPKARRRLRDGGWKPGLTYLQRSRGSVVTTRQGKLLRKQSFRYELGPKSCSMHLLLSCVVFELQSCEAKLEVRCALVCLLRPGSSGRCACSNARANQVSDWTGDRDGVLSTSLGERVWGWLASWLDGWLTGWLAVWQGGFLAGWLAGWLGGQWALV